MIRTVFITLLFTIMSVVVFAQQADDIIGKYHLPNKIDVEIYKVGNKYFGKIIKLNNFEDGQTLDINNSEDTKHNTPILGMEIIKNLEFDSQTKQWINGAMYGAEKGLTFDLKITEYRDNEIEVVGSKFFFWHTLEWKKI